MNYHHATQDLRPPTYNLLPLHFLIHICNHESLPLYELTGCHSHYAEVCALPIEIQKGRVRMCSIFQVDGFIGIVQLEVPFSAWDLGQHIYLDFFVLLTCFSHIKLHTRIIILKIIFCNIIGIISS